MNFEVEEFLKDFEEKSNRLAFSAFDLSIKKLERFSHQNGDRFYTEQFLDNNEESDFDDEEKISKDRPRFSIELLFDDESLNFFAILKYANPNKDTGEQNKGLITKTFNIKDEDIFEKMRKMVFDFRMANAI